MRVEKLFTKEESIIIVAIDSGMFDVPVSRSYRSEKDDLGKTFLYIQPFLLATDKIRAGDRGVALFGENQLQVASTSATVFGMGLPRSLWPASVISMLSSIRIPPKVL